MCNDEDWVGRPWERRKAQAKAKAAVVAPKPKVPKSVFSLSGN